MRCIFSVLIVLYSTIFLAGVVHAGRVYTDSDLEQYGSGSSGSTDGNSDTDTIRGGSDTGDEDEAIRLCTNAVKSGITVNGRHSGVKAVKLTGVTPSTKAADLLYIIDFDAHLEYDIISRVECWVYKKRGEFTYRVISKE